MYKLFIALFLTLSAALAQAQDIKVVYHIKVDPGVKTIFQLI